MIDLIYIFIWYNDRFRSKVLFSNTSNHACGLKVKIMDLEFLCFTLKSAIVFSSLSD